MQKSLLKNKNVLNYCHTVSLLIALSFSHYYITYETQLPSKERGGDPHRMDILGSSSARVSQFMAGEILTQIFTKVTNVYAN